MYYGHGWKTFLLSKPQNTGSEYYDYKGQNSMIMIALVGAHYRFMYVDEGAQGRASDAGVWERSKLGEYLEKEKLQVPSPDPLPFTDRKVPNVIVSDDAFPTKFRVFQQPVHTSPTNSLICSSSSHFF